MGFFFFLSILYHVVPCNLVSRKTPSSVLYVLQPKCVESSALGLTITSSGGQLRTMAIICIGLGYPWDLHDQQLMVGGISYLTLEFLCNNLWLLR